MHMWRRMVHPQYLPSEGPEVVLLSASIAKVLDEAANARAEFDALSAAAEATEKMNEVTLVKVQGERHGKVEA